MILSALTFKPVLYLIVPVAFLLGSIPFGILATKKKGIDIRSVGSKNIGATNVLRSAGKIPAVLTLLGDLLKGILSVVICRLLFMKLDYSPYSEAFIIVVEDLWLAIAGLTAVLGHMFSMFLSFRGGKGVATGFGVLLAYSPVVAGIMLVVWLFIAVIFKYASLAAVCAVSSLPFIYFLFEASFIKMVFGTVLAVLVVYKHRSNIRDILAGTESKIGNKDRQ